MIKLSQGCLGEEEIKEVLSAFEYGYFGLAAKVDEFEQELRNYLGATFAIATNSGTNPLGTNLVPISIPIPYQLIPYQSRTNSAQHPYQFDYVPSWHRVAVNA